MPRALVADISDADLLAELDALVPAKKTATRTPREERIIAGFEDIQRFVTEHGRPPQHGEQRDVFERLYAVRLDRLRGSEECRRLLADMDSDGLLTAAGVAEPGAAFEYDDAALLEELGAAAPEADITQLKHVRPRAEITAAEEIAQRKRCANFDRFKPLFEAVRRDLDAGVRQTRRFGENATIHQGEFFILGGQIAYVAEVPGELSTTEHGHAQGRLRIIYEYGTEGYNLLRSFQRALYKDESGRRITDPDAGPLFGEESDHAYRESGTIYVLRSLSEHPEVQARRGVMHKIGVTGGRVEDRVAGAAADPTFLFADVEVEATWKLFNINRAKLEALIHRVFAKTRFDLSFEDRWGRPVKPREWFLVPLPVIDEAVRRILDGSITRFEYDPSTTSLRELTT